MTENDSPGLWQRYFDGHAPVYDEQWYTQGADRQVDAIVQLLRASRSDRHPRCWLRNWQTQRGASRKGVPCHRCRFLEWDATGGPKACTSC